MHLIEKIVPGKRKHSVQLMEEGSFSLYPAEIRQFSLEEGKEIPDEDYDRIMECLLARGKERAYYLLGRREYSGAELREKLKQDGYPDAVTARIEESLSEYRYLDDMRFCIHFVEAHGQKSMRELKQMLYGKGIAADIMEQVFGTDFDEEANLLRLIRKKAGGKAMKDEEIRKLYRYCIAHGFGYETVRRVLGQYHSDEGRQEL